MTDKESNRGKISKDLRLPSVPNLSEGIHSVEPEKTGFAKMLQGLLEAFPMLSKIFERKEKEFKSLQERASVEKLSLSQSQGRMRRIGKNLERSLPHTNTELDNYSEFQLRKMLRVNNEHAKEGNRDARERAYRITQKLQEFREKDPTRQIPLTESEAAFREHVKRFGDDVEFRGPNTAIVGQKAMRKRAKESRTGNSDYERFTKENSTPVNPAEQKMLRDEYAVQVRKEVETDFDDVKKDPRYKQVMGRMETRLALNEARGDKDDDYHQVALAKTRLENLRRNMRMENSNESVTGKALHDVYVPCRGFAGDTYAMITLAEDPRFPGERRQVVVKDPRSWGGGMFSAGSEMFAREAGIHIKKEVYDSGRARGMRIEFTKPGTYYVGGKKIEVGEDGVKTVESNEQKKPTLKTYPVDFGTFGDKYTSRMITLQEQNGDMVRINVNDMKPGEAMETEGGTRIKRNNTGNAYSVEFTEPGRYTVNGFLKGRTIFGAKQPVVDVPKSSE